MVSSWCKEKKMNKHLIEGWGIAVEEWEAEGLWFKDQPIQSLFLHTEPGHLLLSWQGLKRPFYKHSHECLRLPARTCGRQCCDSRKHLLTFNSACFFASDFRSRSPRALSSLVSSCSRSTWGIKAAADVWPCSYPHFTAGETETLRIVSLPVELHRNVNALPKTKERVGVRARMKALPILYFRSQFPLSVLWCEIQIQDLSKLAFNFSPLIWIARQMERALVHKTHCHLSSLDEAQGKR